MKSLQVNAEGFSRRRSATSHSRHFMSLLAVACLVFCGLEAAVFGQTETWTDRGYQTNNNWSNASNWNPMVVPNGSGYNVTVPLLRSPYTSLAVMDIPVALHSLTIATNAAVSMNSGTSLKLYGNLSGNLRMDPGGGAAASLVISPSTICSACNLQMFASSQINGNGTLTNNLGSTISEGRVTAGDIGGISVQSLQNNGTIFAGQNSTLYLYPTADWYNTG